MEKKLENELGTGILQGFPLTLKPKSESCRECLSGFSCLGSEETETLIHRWMAEIFRVT